MTAARHSIHPAWLEPQGTLGELDANALFYLASRGIAPAEAKVLLLKAFVGSVFDGIADEGERAAVEAAAQAALERVL